MTYDKPLPQLKRLMWLAWLAGPYPTTADRLFHIAKRWKSTPSILNFLRLFPKDERFDNEEDFIVRAAALHLLIREARKSPKEQLYDPQE